MKRRLKVKPKAYAPRSPNITLLSVIATVNLYTRKVQIKAFKKGGTNEKKLRKTAIRENLCNYTKMTYLTRKLSIGFLQI